MMLAKRCLMMLAKRCLLTGVVVAFVFSLAATLRAQTPASGGEAEARKERERRALAILEDVINEGQTLKLAENRIRVQMLVATLLWSREQERARALLKEAQDALNSLAGAASDYSHPQSAENFEIFLQLRREILNLLASRDAQAALGFLRATRRPVAAMTLRDSSRMPDEEASLELNLAGRLAAQDPKQALRLGEESLSKGLSGSLINLLQQLRAKDAEAARKLTGSIVQKLRGVDLANNYETMNLTTSLLNMTRPATASAAAASSGGAGAPSVAAPSNAAPTMTTSTTAAHASVEAAPVIVLDEQTRRDLLDAAAAAVINTQTNRLHPFQGLTKALQEQMAEVEKSAPARAASLRRKLAEFDKIVDPRVKAWREQQSVMESGSLESIVEAAGKAPAEMREALYSQAAWKALSQGDSERARTLAAHISQPQQRAQMLREIDRQTGWRALEQRNFEEAQRALARNLAPQERIPLLIGLAQMAGAQEETKKAARAYLEEAVSLMGGRAENQILFSLKLQLAEAFAGTEPARGFELLEEAVDHLNELLSAAAMLNGYGFDAFKDGELRPHQGYSWGALLEQSINVLSALAPGDFGRALALAQRFERAEVRVMFRLGLAQRFLEQPVDGRTQVRSGDGTTISTRPTMQPIVIEP